MKAVVAGVLLFCWATTAAHAAESYSDLVHHFDYDQKAPLDLREVGAETREGVTIHDISYASPKGGRVSAYLVLPPGKGPYAGILFGHWAKEGSPVRNRKEFLDEAVALAHAGAVSLLIDAPFARPGFHSAPEPLNSQEPLIEQQQVIDLRRGVDLLRSRSEVDPARIAYVGHSFDAALGGILAGVERRLRAYVLMAGTFNVARYLHSEDPRIVALRKQVGEQQLDQYLATWDWLDPAHYVGHTAPAAIFLQYAETDEFVPRAQRQQDIRLFRKPKTIRMYAGTDHALDAQARLDRYRWLRRQIRIDSKAAAFLEHVPVTQ
jgi:dienelactone hydrolase